MELESSVSIIGTVLKDERQVGGYEVHVQDINIIQTKKCSAKQLSKNDTEDFYYCKSGWWKYQSLRYAHSWYVRNSRHFNIIISVAMNHPVGLLTFKKYFTYFSQVH